MSSANSACLLLLLSSNNILALLSLEKKVEKVKIAKIGENLINAKKKVEKIKKMFLV